MRTVFKGQIMKRLLITWCLVFFSCLAVFAQKDSDRFQRIEMAKVAYITKKLDLSPQEAQKFFPLYNEYRKEIREIMYKKRSEDGPKRSFRNELDFDSKVLACKKKYREKFKTAIPASKSSRFFEVEREFREQLFKELQSRNRK